MMLRNRCTLTRAALAVPLAMALHAPPSAAGNMTLSLAGSGVTAAIEIHGFATGLSNDAAPTASSGGGSGAARAGYADFSFTAPQSAASTLLALYASSALHLASAQLKVFSPDGAQLLSKWVLTDVIVGGFSANNGSPAQPRATAPVSFLPPVTSFQLRFSKYDFTVYASDGSVASHMCWDLSANKAC